MSVLAGMILIGLFVCSESCPIHFAREGPRCIIWAKFITPFTGCIVRFWSFLKNLVSFREQTVRPWIYSLLARRPLCGLPFLFVIIELFLG